MSPNSVFLNAPYDKEFEPLFLAYIVGVCGFGLLPRAALEFQGAVNRIDKIVDLIRQCPISIHDMSRVEMSPVAPHLPRFNMPFEFGMAYFHSRTEEEHRCFVFDSDPRQFERSLSDLKGIDPYAHRRSR